MLYLGENAMTRSWKNTQLFRQEFPMSTDFISECLEGDLDAAAASIESRFDYLFGWFLRDSDSNDIKAALRVLRTVTSIHLSLHKYYPEKNIHGDPKALKHVEQIENALLRQGVFEIERGSGYPPIDGAAVQNDDAMQPDLLHCEIYRCRIPLTRSYAKWLKPRMEALRSIGSAVSATTVFYLWMDHVCTIEEAENPVLVVTIYGNQSLNTRHTDFLEEYEEQLPEDANLTEYELYAGLLHLADIIASIHLFGTMPIVWDGLATHASTDDLLTDIWNRIYGEDDDHRLFTGACEVCGNLYVSEKESMRGHAACMNRQRVKRSRAKAYKRALSAGKTPEEASAIAKIAIRTAEEMIATGEV